MKRMKHALRRAGRVLSSGPQPFLIAPSHRRVLDLLPNGTVDLGKTSASSAVVISFGTRDGVYDTYVKQLEESCNSVGQPVAVETFPAMASSNAFSLKATFIKFKLLTEGRPVIWIDSDAVLKAPITLPEGDWDVGFLQNNIDDPKNPVAALCIAFRPSVAALRFLEHWEQFCSAHWLKPGEDHRRLNYTRFVLDGHFREVDISVSVHGKLIRDLGKEKEYSF